MILESPDSKFLKLDFFEACINEDPSVCSKKEKKYNEYYLRYFSKSERKECINYEQVAESLNDVLKFCVDMGNSSWYGGAENTYQYWPLNKLNWTNNAYVTKESASQAVSKLVFLVFCNPISKCILLNYNILNITFLFNVYILKKIIKSK